MHFSRSASDNCKLEFWLERLKERMLQKRFLVELETSHGRSSVVTATHFTSVPGFDVAQCCGGDERTVLQTREQPPLEKGFCLGQQNH